MSNFPRQVEKAIRGEYNFHFGENINRGFEIAKKAIGIFAAFILLFGIINVVFDFFGEELGIFGYVLSLVFSIIISPCLMAGFYYTARKVDENDYYEFANFFKGFDWVGKLAIVALIETGTYIACLLPLFFLSYVEFGDLITGVDIDLGPEQLLNGGILVLIGFIPLLYLSVAWMFAPLLVIFYDMEPWPAMEASRKIITHKWISIFFFLLLAGLIAILGIFGFIIALLFTVPASLCMVYAAFRDIVGMPEETEDDILDHLIEEV